MRLLTSKKKAKFLKLFLQNSCSQLDNGNIWTLHSPLLEFLMGYWKYRNNGSTLTLHSGMLTFLYQELLVTLWLKLNCLLVVSQQS